MVGIVDRLLRYDGWAATRVLLALKSASTLNPKALRLLAHLLVAERVWYLRLQGEDTTGMNLSPELSLEECEQLAEQNRNGYHAYLTALSAEKLDSVVTYRNSKGVEFQTSVKDILLHVMLHGAYHRGQIATAVRADGGVPVDTDYIIFTREG